MKKGICILLTFLLMLSFVGCSTEPTYYSEGYVKEYVKQVYGRKCEYIECTTYEDENGNPVYVYHFEDKNGVEFRVEAYSTHISIDASTSIFYQKRLRDYYASDLFAASVGKIQSVCEEQSLEFEIAEYNDVKVKLTEYTQIAEAAKLIEEIDFALNLEYKAEGYDGHKPGDISVTVYLMPDEPTEDTAAEDTTEETEEWTEHYQNRISSIDLSTDKDERLDAEELATKIERALVDAVKTGKSPQYSLPDRILYKYPAPVIRVTSINGDQVLAETIDLGFSYDVETDAYWTSGLDPCQDFEGIYNYTKRGAFKNLVEILGGTYECEEWKATWEIGDDTWVAKLQVDKDKRYKDFAVKKNGEKIEISDAHGTHNGTTSGRSFTVADLEAMLGVTIEIDQVSMTATVNTKND